LIKKYSLKLNDMGKSIIAVFCSIREKTLRRTIISKMCSPIRRPHTQLKSLVEDNDINPTGDLWYLSSDDIEPFEWYRRFFGGGRRGLGGDFLDDMFMGFDQMKREMEREFENIQKRIPKDLIREYNTPQGGTVREVGPIVYGYSITI
jgi:hypothetical protein